MVDIIFDNENGKIFAPILEGNTVQTQSGGPVSLTGHYTAKAVMNYRGDTNVINNSVNFSSVTDSGVGYYAFSYTNLFSGSDYFASFMSSPEDSIGGTGEHIHPITEITRNGMSASTITTKTYSIRANNWFDIDPACLTIHGDLA